MDFTSRTQASSASSIITRLKPWDERTAPEDQMQAVLARIQAASSRVPEATVSAFGVPPIPGLSITGGFQMMLEDRLGRSVEELAEAANQLAAQGNRQRELTGVVSTFRASVPSYKIDLDVDKVQTLGIPLSDAYNTLQTFLGGLYVNDFNTFGRTWQVLVQSEPEFRDDPADIGRFYVRSSSGAMVPLGTLVTVSPTARPDVVFRYNRYRAAQILGRPKPGISSGQASDSMEALAAKSLPDGYSTEWTGTTYQEKAAQGHEGVIFGFASVLVFLCLAALYESWSIPFAVLFALPLGVFGALLAVDLRSYPYDIYTQIGIVTLIGLAAKNAILIVEFARMRREHGESIREAAMDAARLRLRPILMTSFAFILGVTPLMIATGAGAASRRSLGTAVFGGMNAATMLAIFLVPVLYFVIQNIVERRRKARSEDEELAEQPE
jgi:hydrophobe/amphiphile efflux-1 (HAE1) family protein